MQCLHKFLVDFYRKNISAICFPCWICWSRGAALCNKHSLSTQYIQDISTTVSVSLSLIHYKSWYNLNRFSKCNWLIWIFTREQPSWCIDWLNYGCDWFRIMTRRQEQLNNAMEWDEHFYKETEIIIVSTTLLLSNNCNKSDYNLLLATFTVLF